MKMTPGTDSDLSSIVHIVSQGCSIDMQMHCSILALGSKVSRTGCADEWQDFFIAPEVLVGAIRDVPINTLPLQFLVR